MNRTRFQGLVDVSSRLTPRDAEHARLMADGVLHRRQFELFNPASPRALSSHDADSVLAADDASFDVLQLAYDKSGGIACGDNLFAVFREFLPAHAESLARAIAAGRVFTFSWCSWTWIPMAQLGRDLTWSNRMACIRAELDSTLDGWAIAVWFASRHEFLRNQRPVDLMDSAFLEVLDAARRDRGWRSGSNARP